MPTPAPSTARQVYTRLVRFMAQLADTASGKGASLVGVEDSGGLFTADDVESALAESATKIAALGAENTDVVIPVDLSNFLATAGTWTLTRQGAGQYRLRRTAGAASEGAAFRVQPKQRTTASKGFKVTGFKMKYTVTTADVVDITVAGVRSPMPATGNAVAAATSLGAVTYDTAHDTTAERKAQGEHTMQGTFATPVYLNSESEIELLVTCDSTGIAGAVFDIWKLELLGSETLVDLA